MLDYLQFLVKSEKRTHTIEGLGTFARAFQNVSKLGINPASCMVREGYS